MVKAWREIVTIPTYEVGKPEKNPMFLERNASIRDRVVWYILTPSLSRFQTRKWIKSGKPSGLKMSISRS